MLLKLSVKTRADHLESAARILLVEEAMAYGGKLIDTKKVYLDRFVKSNRDNLGLLNVLKENCTKILDVMSSSFMDSDDLLRSQGNIVLYYLLFRDAIQLKEDYKVTREKLLRFKDLLQENRILAEISDEDDSKVSYELLEYERLTQQGTNDASNIRERLRVLSKQMGLSNIEP